MVLGCSVKENSEETILDLTPPFLIFRRSQLLLPWIGYERVNIVFDACDHDHIERGP